MILTPLLCCAAVTLSDPIALYQQALAAREQHDSSIFLERARRLAEWAPMNPSLRFLHAEALASSGQSERALPELRWLAEHGYHYAFWERATFESLSTRRDIEALRVRTARNGQPSGKIARLIRADADLNAEGIDLFAGGWVVGSMNGGLHRIDASGATAVLWRETEPSRRVLGVRNDARRKLVWACSTGLNDREPHSELLRVSLQPSEVRRFRMPDSRSLCNDVALLPGGVVAVSDSHRGGVWLLTEGGDWRALVPPETLGYPNGLTYFAPLQRLVVTDLRGLWAIDLSGDVEPVTAPAGTFVGGIDGLYATTGTVLLAIQNAQRPQRVLRMHIATDPLRVERIVVLASNLPELAEMRTAAVGAGEVTVLSATAGQNADASDRRTQLVQIVSSGFADD